MGLIHVAPSGLFRVAVKVSESVALGYSISPLQDFLDGEAFRDAMVLARVHGVLLTFFSAPLRYPLIPFFPPAIRYPPETQALPPQENACCNFQLLSLPFGKTNHTENGRILSLKPTGFERRSTIRK